MLFRPAVPDLLLRTSPLNIENHGRILYYDVGRSASVVMLEQDGGLALRTNGLPEAMMDMPGTPPAFSGEFWLSPLAVIARPRTESMLIVGYGGGVVIEGVPPSVRSVDVIELEPQVIEANRATRALRKRDPLADPRVHLISNDARGALSLTARKYDAIVSQPSHPWTAGASHLYTLEFMQQARDHLNDGGVFVQWMNVTFMDEALLRSLTATLLTVFERSADLSAGSRHPGVPRLRRTAQSRSSSRRHRAAASRIRPSTTRGWASTPWRTWSPRSPWTKKARARWRQARR